MVCRFLIFTFLVVLSVYSTVYTISAYQVAVWAFEENDEGYWRCCPSATFFPWPKGCSQGILPQIVIRMNALDEFIYLRLIKTGILILICLSLWSLTVIYCFKAILHPIKAWKLTKSQAKVM
jgi:hypothetical protein